jgi:hypothetical protein
MKAKRWMLGVLFCGAVCGAQLAQAADAGETALGKVHTIYVRVSDNLFFERKLVRPAPAQELWADVRPAQDSGKANLYKLPQDVKVEPADVVATREGDNPLVAPLIPEVSRVTHIVAKHDTIRAIAFGLPASKSVVHRFTQTDVCRAPAGSPAGLGVCEKLASLDRDQ